jgi:hypothetical protein
MSNSRSTDSFGSFPCYGQDALAKYLNSDAVQEVIHVNRVPKITWANCNNAMNDAYYQEYPDTGEVFKSILSKAKDLTTKGVVEKFKILIYNGKQQKNELVCKCKMLR